MLVARPLETICPAGAVTDALKRYGGVVKEGVEMGKLGRVVEMVWEMLEKKADTSEGDSTGAETLRRG